MSRHARLEFDYPPSTSDKWTNDNIIHGVIEQATYGTEFPGIVVDIGANIGAFTCFAASRGARHVYAYEPSPLNFGYLERNVKRNGLENVTLVNKGLGTPGTRSFYTNEVNCGAFTMFRRTDKEVESEIEVISLADVFTAHGLSEIDILKSDCEGAEWEFLTEAPPELFKKIHKIVMEVHLVNGRTSDDWEPATVEMTKFLNERGYNEVVIRPANVRTAFTVWAQRA